MKYLKKFEIPGFLKKHFWELSPQLSPTAFWTTSICFKTLEKHRISYRNSVLLCDTITKRSVNTGLCAKSYCIISL